MNRTATRIFLFLLLGAILTAAVAWACALWARLEPNIEKQPVRGAGWPVPTPPGWTEPSLFTRQHGIGLRNEWFVGGFDMIKEAYRDDPRLATFRMSVDRCGLPFAALRTVRAEVLAVGIGDIVPVQLGPFVEGLSVPRALLRRNAPGRKLPLRPEWPGFALDSVVFGCASWLLAFLVQWLKRHARLRRHLCPHCAYPIGISPVCTECGHPLEPRSGALQ